MNGSIRAGSQGFRAKTFFMILLDVSRDQSDEWVRCSPRGASKGDNRMTTFTIDCDNNITAFASLQEAQAAGLAGVEHFSSAEELTQLAASWPIAGTHGRGSSKLRELLNSLPSVPPTKKFPDRQTALAKIWEAAQALTPPGGAPGAHGAKKPKGSKKKATPAKKAAPARHRAKKAVRARKGSKKTRQGKDARDGSKKAEVLELMRRKQGATLKEIMKATGWQARTVRGFVSGTLIKKQGLKVESFPQRGEGAHLPDSHVASPSLPTRSRRQVHAGRRCCFRSDWFPPRSL
jgi:hypothetical protein